VAAVETLGKLSLNAKDAVPALIERIPTFAIGSLNG
jgi:hypothetical protein